MRHWHGLLFIGVTAAGCGGATKSDTDPIPSGATSGIGGTTSGGSGGFAGTYSSAGGDLIFPTGGAESGGTQSGGVESGGQGTGANDAGGAGGDGCNETVLWYTVARRAIGGLGSCGPSTCEEGGVLFGAVTFDAEGQAMAITGLDADSTEEWFGDVAGERWSCLAGQTVEYCCVGH